MKTIIKTVLALLVLAGLQLAIVGCVAEVRGGGYRDGGSVWFSDGPWLDGGGWDRGHRGGERGGERGGGIEVHPPGHRR